MRPGETKADHAHKVWQSFVSVCRASNHCLGRIFRVDILPESCPVVRGRLSTWSRPTRPGQRPWGEGAPYNNRPFEIKTPINANRSMSTNESFAWVLTIGFVSASCLQWEGLWFDFWGASRHLGLLWGWGYWCGGWEGQCEHPLYTPSICYVVFNFCVLSLHHIMAASRLHVSIYNIQTHLSTGKIPSGKLQKRRALLHSLQCMLYINI